MNERWEATPRYPGAFATIGEVWRYRKLFSFIGSRALRKMYRRTVLGWLWLFINPLFPIALRAVVFGGLLGVGSDGIPYFLFLLTGTVVWEVFAASLMWGTRSLEMHGDLSDQVYHPRAILPLGNMTPALLNVALKIGVLALAIIFYTVRGEQLRLRVDVGLLWALAALALALLFALGISFFTSIWGETARDIRFGLNQLLSVWYLLTPVLYPLSQVPEAYRSWVLLNPLAIIVETFKWGLFGVGQFYADAFAVTSLIVAAVFLSGLTYFSRSEAQTSAQR
jgi:lipopolysaccharide transport system permease protein